MNSLIPKELARDHGVDERAKSVIRGPGFREDPIDILVVADADGLPSGVGDEFLGDAPRDMIGIREQKVLELGEIREPSTVWEHVAGLDAGSVTVLIRGEVFRQRTHTVVDPILPLGGDPIPVTSAADDVVILEREAGRIDL